MLLYRTKLWTVFKGPQDDDSGVYVNHALGRNQYILFLKNFGVVHHPAPSEYVIRVTVLAQTQNPFP